MSFAYSYCFKTIVDDTTATISLTCFSPQADTITTECNKVQEKLEKKDPYQLPPNLQLLEGTTHIFQFHFTKESKLDQAYFILDEILSEKPLSIMPLNTDLPLTISAPDIEPSEQPTDTAKESIEISTPPSEPQMSEAKKNNAKIELPKKSARKVLFEYSEEDTAKRNSKKPKYER